MPRPRLAAVAAAFCYAACVAAQAQWEAGQVNTTMCFWEQPRAAVVRDTLYIDGGDLWWLPGLASGQYDTPVSDANPLGVIYTLNFSTAFNTSQNFTAVLGTLLKAGGGAANNLAPNYVDGALLANNDEFFLFGGLLAQTAEFSPPSKDQVTVYEKYQYGVQRNSFIPGFISDSLTGNLTRYIAFGGAASAPSENKAWYFGGMQSQSRGEIFFGSNQTLTPTNVSNYMVTLDLSTQQQETWSNTSLPKSVSARANPEVVWVPIGAQGILVVLGGVDFPEFATSTHQSANAAQSKIDSPSYMSNIDIYDIAGNQWYQQPTTSGPGQLTRGCAVVAPATDYSSFNIYYYGGYSGLDATSAFNDDVWVLSIPSFVWTKVTPGNGGHSRAGHKCVMPYPDQMIVVGGYTNQSGVSPACVGGNIVQVYNLTTGAWVDGYDPATHADYGVPPAVVSKIGGSKSGGATMTTPAPSGWANTALAAVFQTPYPTSKITTFYPYSSTAPANNTNPNFTAPSDVSHGGSGLPSWAPIVLGVVLGLVFVTCVGVAILFWRRRKYLRRGPSEDGTEDTNGHRILSWMRGQQSDAKAPTVTTEETAPVSPNLEPASAFVVPAVVEIGDSGVIRAELADTSPPIELHDTALTPAEIINKHSHFGSEGSLNNPSFYSSITQTDHASTVSRSSGGNAPPVNNIPPPALYRPAAPSHISFDRGSPGADVTPSTAAAVSATSPVLPHFGSGVSAVSETDRTHLRQISDTTVSSVMSGGSRMAATSQAPSTGVPLAVPEQLTPGSPSPGDSPATEGAISPPSAGVTEGADYMTVRRSLGVNNGGNSATPGSPLRRSVFVEHHDDMASAPPHDHESGSGAA